MTDIDITDKCWIKLGRINVHPIPDSVLEYPVIEGNNSVLQNNGYFQDMFNSDKYNNFWFKKPASPNLVLTGRYPAEYFEKFNLPMFPFKAVCFVSISETLDWHVDTVRMSSINIALKNGNAARCEFEDGSSYIMEDGDVYSTDPTKKHRIAIDHAPLGKRIILSAGLPEEFSSQGTKEILRSIKDYLSRTSSHTK